MLCEITARVLNMEEERVRKSNKLLNSFLTICKRLLRGESLREKCLKLIKARFSNALAEFTASLEFEALVVESCARLNGDPTNIFVHIKYFCDEMQKHQNAKPHKMPSKEKTNLNAQRPESGSKIRRVVLASCEKVSSTSDNGESPRIDCQQSTINSLPKSRKDEVDGETCVNSGCDAGSEQCSKCCSDRREESVAITLDSLVTQVDSGLQADTKEDTPLTCDDGIATSGHSYSVHLPVVEETNNDEPRPGPSGEQDRLHPTDSPSASDDENEVRDDIEKRDKEEKNERRQMKIEKHIKKLHKLLKCINNKIRELQSEELTLDDLDDDDSAYLLEDKLLKRGKVIWERICELEGQIADTGRPIHAKFRFDGTKYPKMNKRVEFLVNKKKIFPNYQEILGIVKKTNNSENLSLSDKKQELLARKMHESVGEILKKRRIKDFTQSFGNYLTDEVDIEADPACVDDTLAEKLCQNEVIGKEKMNTLLQTYTEKQNCGEEDAASSGDEDGDNEGNNTEQEEEEGDESDRSYDSLEDASGERSDEERSVEPSDEGDEPRSPIPEVTVSDDSGSSGSCRTLTPSQTVDGEATAVVASQQSGLSQGSSSTNERDVDVGKSCWEYPSLDDNALSPPLDISPPHKHLSLDRCGTEIAPSPTAKMAWRKSSEIHGNGATSAVVDDIGITPAAVVPGSQCRINTDTRGMEIIDISDSPARPVASTSGARHSNNHRLNMLNNTKSSMAVLPYRNPKPKSSYNASLLHYTGSGAGTATLTHHPLGKPYTAPYRDAAGNVASSSGYRRVTSSAVRGYGAAAGMSRQQQQQRVTQQVATTYTSGAGGPNTRTTRVTEVRETVVRTSSGTAAGSKRTLPSNEQGQYYGRSQSSQLQQRITTHRTWDGVVQRRWAAAAATGTGTGTIRDRRDNLVVLDDDGDLPRTNAGRPRLPPTHVNTSVYTSPTKRLRLNPPSQRVNNHTSTSSGISSQNDDLIILD